MAMDVGIPMESFRAAPCPPWGFLMCITGSCSSCRVNHGLIPEREGGEALGADFSAVPFTEVQVCCFILYFI